MRPCRCSPSPSSFDSARELVGDHPLGEHRREAVAHGLQQVALADAEACLVSASEGSAGEVFCGEEERTANRRLDVSSARTAFAAARASTWNSRHARSEGEAEDLAQGFFEQLLRLRTHATADPARGRFRNYLLLALKRFLARQRVAAHAVKRGGGELPLALDDPQAPPGLAQETDTPDAVFERAWAEALLGRAMAHLQEEAAAAGKLELFRALRAFLLEAPAADEYAVVAERLGMRRNTLAVAIHRLRQRLHERLREEVAETVDEPADVEAEMDALGGSLRKPSAM